MDGEVQTHQLGELRVVEAEHGAVVGRPILVVVDGADAFAITVRVAVDGRRNHWQFSNQVHGVFVHVLLNKTRLNIRCTPRCNAYWRLYNIIIIH